jgi:hypothetical protein
MGNLLIDGAMPDADSLAGILARLQAQVAVLTNVTGSGVAGQVAFYTGPHTVGGNADFQHVTGGFQIGASPFTFLESSPGVLQLGNAGLTFDSAQQLLSVATGVILGQTFPGAPIIAYSGYIDASNNSGWVFGASNDLMLQQNGTFGGLGEGAAFGFQTNTGVNSGQVLTLKAEQALVCLSDDLDGGAWWPQNPGDNAQDLGLIVGTALNGGAKSYWRTGYFGTSVVSPLITSTTGNFSGTVTAAAFVTASLQAAFVASPYGAAAGNTGEYRFLELAANGTDYVALKAPDALAAPLTYTLPAVDHIGPWMSNGSGLLSVASGQDLTIVIPVANKTLTFTKGVLTGVV